MMSTNSIRTTVPEMPSAAPRQPQWPKAVALGVLALLGLTFLGLLHAYLARSNFVQAFRISSASMAPTLLTGDRILVDKTISPRDVQKRDIVVFVHPENPKKRFVSRVVGLPGDRIEIRRKQLMVNAKPVKEDYIIHSSEDLLPKRDNFAPVVVPPASLFVMGDNRDRSYDSRFWGSVDFKKILGRVDTIYWSWDRERLTVRWERIGKKIG